MPNSDPHLRDGLTPNTDVELYESAAAGSGGVSGTIAYTEADDTAALAGTTGDAAPQGVAIGRRSFVVPFPRTPLTRQPFRIAYTEDDDGWTAAINVTAPTIDQQLEELLLLELV